MLYWHRFAPESRMMRNVTDALLDYGHKVLSRIKPFIAPECRMAA
jgi:LysR family transcriptional regulator (chromosome initiation inhibitor)